MSRHADVVCLCASCGCSQCYIMNELPFVMLVEGARGDLMGEAYSSTGLITAL